MSNTTSSISEANAKRLLWAGFMAILATGVGFSVRAGILGQWADQFGFTMTELGTITGGGLIGFGIVIILSSLIADSVGYGKLMVGAFALHLISAVLTLATPAFFASGGKEAAYWCLFIAMFIFAVGNGVCEAVVNPLTATLFPKQQTHYLNILHAGWPAGLVIGSVASALMSKRVDAAGVVTFQGVDWKIQMCLFLIPVVIYGLMMIGQRFPKSDASVAGVSIGEMLSTLAAPLLIVLVLVQIMVGYVELGTDSWISNITGAIMADPVKGLILFSYTSLLMFVLRFFAGPIVHRVSPVGLLLISAILGFIGLQMLGAATTVVMCVIAATIYACGKTFLWPTMLSVASERFPKSGAIGIGIIGGAGMLSAGLLGGPAIGFKQDYNASHRLEQVAPATYDRYKADKENTFAGMKTLGLDGAKVGVLKDDGKDLVRTGEILAKEGRTDQNHQKLSTWWDGAKAEAATDKPLVEEAGLFGGKMALKLTSIIPAIMAIFYLGMLIYFKSIGGYRRLDVDGTKH
jgi:MFS family permease